MNAWIAAARPRTLLVGAAPVVVGAALAFDNDVFHAASAGAALAGALTLQIGANLANDYYDHQKGADGVDRAGPRRASASGDIPAKAVRDAAFGTFLVAALLGLYLIWRGGWPILAIGAAGITSGLLYTAGPRPLGYIGLGEVFAFLFFGPVAVLGTVYVQAPSAFGDVALWLPALFLGVALGCLAAAVLVVNNLRDIPTDAAAGKRTLAVRIGERASRIEYTTLLVLPYLLAIVSAARHHAMLLLPLLTLPFAIGPLRTVWKEHLERSALNPALGGTARLMFLFALTTAVAVVWP